MKKFVSIAAIVMLLLATAIYYGSLNRQNSPTHEPSDPVVPTPHNLVTPTAPGSPQAAMTSAGTLTLSSAISHAYIQQDAVNQVYATVDITAIAHESTNRPPLNVSLVIDRSGSMAGDKIQYAKQAARRLVGMLSDQDRVSIVSYGSDVSVNFGSRPVTGHNREYMLNAIDRIEVSGGTNLSGGYERGLSEVRSWKDSRAINRVLLMSDGNANIGITYLPELQKLSRDALAQSVSLTTIGVGLDYNEDLMASMANEGAGNYYFVDNASTITQSFERELNGLTSTVARDTALVIKLAPGVTLGELYGFPFRQQGDSIMISFAEFYSKQNKNVLLKLNVPADASTRDVMSAQLSYTDLIHGDKLAHQVNTLHSVSSSDAAAVEAHINRDVIARVQQVEVANSMKKAMDMYSTGNAEDAVRLLERQQQNTRRARERYDIKGENFDRVDTEISTMNSMMKKTAPSSNSGRRMIKSKKARSHDIVSDYVSF